MNKMNEEFKICQLSQKNVEFKKCARSRKPFSKAKVSETFEEYAEKSKSIMFRTLMIEMLSLSIKEDT